MDENYEIKLHLKDKIKNFESYLLSKKSRLKDNDVKVYVIEKGLLTHYCYICKMKPMWRNKPLDLILDRKNNIFNDNRLDNLRLICPNCYCQIKKKTSIFFKHTKDNVTFCIDCGKKIRAATSGKKDKKCIHYRCKPCLEKAITTEDI